MRTWLFSFLGFGEWGEFFGGGKPDGLMSLTKNELCLRRPTFLWSPKKGWIKKGDQRVTPSGLPDSRLRRICPSDIRKIRRHKGDDRNAGTVFRGRKCFAFHSTPLLGNIAVSTRGLSAVESPFAGPGGIPRSPFFIQCFFGEAKKYWPPEAKPLKQ